MVTVHYATADGTARADSDYVATSGTLRFRLGQVAKTIRVTVESNSAREDPEGVVVDLSRAINATISVPQRKAGVSEGLTPGIR